MHAGKRTSGGCRMVQACYHRCQWQQLIPIRSEAGFRLTTWTLLRIRPASLKVGSAGPGRTKQPARRRSGPSGPTSPPPAADRGATAANTATTLLFAAGAVCAVRSARPVPAGIRADGGERRRGAVSAMGGVRGAACSTSTAAGSSAGNAGRRGAAIERARLARLRGSVGSHTRTRCATSPAASVVPSGCGRAPGRPRAAPRLLNGPADYGFGRSLPPACRPESVAVTSPQRSPPSGSGCFFQPLQREPRRRGAAPVDRVARGAPAGARLPVQRPPARAVVQPGRVEVETPRSGSQGPDPADLALEHVLPRGHDDRVALSGRPAGERGRRGPDAASRA